MTSGADWDATRYHRVAQPHAAWGANVLDRLRLAGDELVLDAGCGSGRVTAQLLERLPRGRVIAADHSPAMLDGKPLWRYYATPEETEVRLLQAGFKDPRAWLEPSSQTFADPAALADFCRGVVLSNHMAVLPDNLRQAFADQVVDEITQR